MGTHYVQLTAPERMGLMLLLAEGKSQRAAAAALGRAPSTICRELARNRTAAPHAEGMPPDYDGRLAEARAQELLHAPGRNPKLGPNTVLFSIVKDYLAEGWSPEQVAGILDRAFPDDPSKTVVHETIYSAIYVMPRGELRRELIDSLRQRHAKRRPRSRGDDRRGKIADMTSIHMRPPEIEDRLVPGHWEGDLIKGAGNRSSVGTLIERTSRVVMLARMDNATAEGCCEAFTAALNRVPAEMRKTLTYDQGKEMARHADLALATGVKIYFADPHSPWQRGSNENTNGLLRQYLPKGTDLSIYSQRELDVIAHRLNTRPRKMHGFRTPLEVYADHQQAIDGAD